MPNEDNCDPRTPLNESTLAPRQKANRSNAQKSTGPQTARGKARSRLNAVKHGLFAKETLSNLSPADTRKYTLLLRGLVARYQPSDLVEELLVQEMAQGIWGECRVQRWELFAVERLAASLAQASTEIVSEIIIPRDAERLAEYGARFHARWLKAMRELERLRNDRLSKGQQDSLQPHESEEPRSLQ